LETLGDFIGMAGDVAIVADSVAYCLASPIFGGIII